MERGHRHGDGTWAQGDDVGTERGCGCDTRLVLQKGRSLLSAPQAKRRECVWPWGAKKALGDLWSSALGVPGGTVQVNACQEPHECSALPGTHPRPCQPSPWGVPWGRQSPAAPAHAKGAGLPGQATPCASAPMNRDHMNLPGGSCTGQEEQAHDPPGLSFCARGPPGSWAGGATARPGDCRARGPFCAAL